MHRRWIFENINVSNYQFDNSANHQIFAIFLMIHPVVFTCSSPHIMHLDLAIGGRSETFWKIFNFCLIHH